MSVRSTVLIVDKEGNLSEQLSKDLKSQGYHTICVQEPSTVIPLIDSRDRIYAMVYVDENLSSEAALVNIGLLKQLGPGVPVVFTTAKNEPSKEKAVRRKGVFFYHVESSGLAELTNAVLCAMKDAIKKDGFIPGCCGE